MRASELIRQSLLLINVPGRGGLLQPEDFDQAFRSLTGMMAKETVSKAMTPGIRQHFFQVTESKRSYSYGRDPAADFRSDLFDDDRPPYKIECARVLTGVSITDNELIRSPKFEEDNGDWTQDGSRIADNQLVMDTAGYGNASGVPITRIDVLQALTKIPVVVGTTYRIRIDAVVNHGAVNFLVNQLGVPLFTFLIDGTGVYEFDYTFPISQAAGVRFFGPTDLAGVILPMSVVINSISMTERGKKNVELVDSNRTEYPLKQLDQKRFNKQQHHYTTSVRPHYMNYNRTKGLSHVRFNTAPPVGTILLFDVLNGVVPEDLEDEININEEMEEFIIYSLAKRLAPQFGKELSRSQREILEEARGAVITLNGRPNNRSVDEGLLQGNESFDVYTDEEYY